MQKSLPRPPTSSDHPWRPRLLNLHGKRYRHRMATCHARTWKTDEFPGDVQDHDLAFHAPASNLAEDVAWKVVAVLVNAVEVPRG